MTRIRLDEALVARGLVNSRSRARDSILRGLVSVNGAPARKPSQAVSNDNLILVEDEAGRWVSRAALKLVHGLDYFQIDVAARSCLDLGASTGGFTQVLLARGAAHVTAIDVGHGQMVEGIASDHRVRHIEGLNVRALDMHHMPENLSLIVCDVSFISLKLALPPVLELAPVGCKIIALIKPQFEVGKGALGKGGIVRDQALLEAACSGIAEFLTAQDWSVYGITPAPISGGDGNQEFLIAAEKQST